MIVVVIVFSKLAVLLDNSNGYLDQWWSQLKNTVWPLLSKATTPKTDKTNFSFPPDLSLQQFLLLSIKIQWGSMSQNERVTLKNFYSICYKNTNIFIEDWLQKLLWVLCFQCCWKFVSNISNTVTGCDKIPTPDVSNSPFFIGSVRSVSDLFICIGPAIEDYWNESLCCEWTSLRKPNL